MKIINSLLLTATLIVSINCSATTKTSVENGNANSPNQTAAATNVQTNSVEESPIESAAQSASTPEGVVGYLYKQHDAQKSPFFQTKSRALVDKHFDKNLADLIWNEAKQPKDGYGALEADPLYDAQDTQIKRFAVGKSKITGDRAEVVVSFVNYTTPVKITYTLVKRAAEWKISDIIYDTGGTLTGIYRDYAESTSEAENQTPGEFEGKYRVGETTCTVKPVKMAFEVRWEKGSGVEMFFFQSRDNDIYTFASDPKSGKANVFTFNNGNYDSGIFYRADGREFPISRVE